MTELIAHWNGVGIKLRPGASDQAIGALERELGVQLPLELNQILRCADGFVYGDCDEEMFEWCGLDRLGERFHLGDEGLHRTEPDDQFLVFEHYCFHACVYIIRASRGPTESSPVWRSFDEWDLRAESISDFVHAYLEDAYEVLLGE